MKAMLLENIALLEDCPEPLALAEIPIPEPAAGEVLIQVTACGVCHTELDEIEGRTPPPVLPVIPGHEVVGRVARLGADAVGHKIGDRVGVGWIFSSSGSECENISDEFVATGRDANGGYAEYVTVPEHYAFPLPDGLDDVAAAPLLCAGSVGYRALKLCNITNGDILGLTGFGGSGHLVLQLAKYLYPESPVYVFARDGDERAFAMELGAAWAGDTADTPPRRPHAVIDTTPAWRPVLAALQCLRPGGRLVINAIRKEDADKSLMADINYAKHLWQEKELKSVANVTGNDIRDCLAIAAKAGIRPEVETYPLRDANRALYELATARVRGAKVLVIGSQ